MIDDTIKEKKLKLKEVKEPTEVIAGSTDVDDQMNRLAVNIRIFNELKLLAGTEAVKLEQEYNKKTMDMANLYTEEMLKELGIVRSDKFKYIKYVLHTEGAALEKMRITYRYFADMYQCYTEWINIYKKTRVPDRGY